MAVHWAVQTVGNLVFGMADWTAESWADATAAKWAVEWEIRWAVPKAHRKVEKMVCWSVADLAAH